MSEKFGKLFKVQLYMVVAVVVYIVVILLAASGMSGDAPITLVKLLTFVLLGYTLYVGWCCRNESLSLKENGLKSMGLVANSFTILLVVQAIFAVIVLVILCSDRMQYMSAFSDLFDLRYRYSTPIGILFLMLLGGIAWFVAAAFMIAGWWSVRSELPNLLEEVPAEAMGEGNEDDSEASEV